MVASVPWLLYLGAIYFIPGNVQTTRLDLQGVTLNVSVNLASPFCNFKIVDNKIKKQYSIEFELLEPLESKFNFTTNLVNENQIWGNLVNGKHWTGTVGSVANQTSQIGMCSLSITHQRQKAVDFSSILTYDHITFMSKKPGLSSRKWIILSPFNIYVWLSILVSFITLTITINISSQLIPSSHSISFQSILLRLAKIFLKQHIGGIHSRTRWFYLLWFVAALVLSNSYCGCFYSILALPEMEPPLDAIKDLVHLGNEDKITITSIKGAAYLNAFLEASAESNQVYYQIAENIKRNNPKLGVKVFDPTVIVEQSAVPTVFVRSRSLLTFNKILNAHLPLHVSSDNFENDFYAVAFAKESPLYHSFNRVIQHSFEFGLTQHWTRNVYYQTPETLQNKLETIKLSERIGALRLLDLYSILICWIIGNAIAFLVFLLECLIFVFKQACLCK